MRLSGKMINSDKSEGFVEVNEFDGQTTKISTKKLAGLAKLLTQLGKMGFGSVEIGIEQGYPLLVFLDKDKRLAYSITEMF